jgi:hypothetical protein
MRPLSWASGWRRALARGDARGWVKGAGRALARPGLGVLAILLSLGALELVLRAHPTLLGREFANGALSRYTSGAGGIYYTDAALGIHFMIPDHGATMHYNGYRWRHRTDRLGFRTRALHVPADVVLLGDSIVYGHGVEIDDTLASALEGRTGLTVANLGHQGDCAFQEAYRLTENLGRFRPRWVVHVFSPNDVLDLYAYLGDDAMRRFIATPVEMLTYPPRTDPAAALRQRRRTLRQRSIWQKAAEGAYVAKMVRWLHLVARARGWQAGAGPAHALIPAGRLDRPDVSADPTSLGWRYTEHAILYMAYRSRQTGARFLLAPVATASQFAILEELARRHALALVDTRVLWRTPSFLPNDGHLSPEGARRMADLIAAAMAPDA